MAIAQIKELNIKSENTLSSGDHIKNNVKAKINNYTRTSMESRIAGGDGLNIKSKETEDTADTESAYADSFCSDHSDDESVLSDVSHHSSINEHSLYCYTNSKPLLRKQDFLTLNKKCASTSKICDDISFKLENKMKCLSLNEVRQTRSGQIQRPCRKNMSFSNEEISRIERDNEILLRKIMAQQRSQKVKIQPSQTKLCSSAINRKKFQRKIEEDNMMLLRRLQQAKSCALNTNKIQGYRATRF